MAEEDAEPSVALIILDMSVEQFKEVDYQAKLVKENCRKLALSDFFQYVVDCKLWIEDPAETTLSWVDKEAGLFKYVANSDGAALIDSLRGLDNIVPIAKKHYSAFAISTLLETLVDKGITHVCVSGLHTDTSVFATVMDSFVNGFETFVVTDAISTSRGQEAHEEGLRNLERHFGDDVLVKLDDLLTDEAEYEEEIVSEEEIEEEIIEEYTDDEFDPEEEQERIEEQRKKIEAARKADEERLAKQAEDAKEAERVKLEEEIKKSEKARKEEEAKLEKRAKKAAEAPKKKGWFGGGSKAKAAPAPAPAPAKKTPAPAPAPKPKPVKAPAPAKKEEEPGVRTYKFPFSNKPKKTTTAPKSSGGEQQMGSNVAAKMKDLKKSGLTGPPKQKRLKTPKIVTDTREEWDKKGNITRTIIKYITEVDGTKRTEKTVEHIPAKK